MTASTTTSSCFFYDLIKYLQPGVRNTICHICSRNALFKYTAAKTTVSSTALKKENSRSNNNMKKPVDKII